MNNSVLYLSAACLFCICCSPREDSASRKDKAPVPVKTITAGEDSSDQTSRFIGEIVPEKTVILTTPYPGTVVRMAVKQGQTVHQGQVIAEISSQTVNSSAEIARANVNQARDAYERVRKVYEKGSISQLQMVDMKTQLTKAEASAKAAEKSLEDCRIKAPYSGTVSETFVDKGVEVGLGQPLVSIMDNGSVLIRISVHENEINLISTGDDATVDIPSLGLEGLHAEVCNKNIVSAPMSHSYECRLKLDAIPQGVISGMAAKVSFRLSGKSSIVIPADAIQMDKDGKYVWIDDGGTAKKNRIEINGYSGQGVIIKNGLNVGDKVICEGYHKISSGMKVSE